MDETYIRVKGKWKYLYRAVDSNGNTIDFMLSAKRNKKAAKRFLKKALGSKHGSVAKRIFLQFDTIFFTLMCHFLLNEID